MKKKTVEVQPKKKSVGKRLVTAVVAGLAALVLLIAVGGRLYFRLPVLGYYRASEKAFRIPDLGDGFIPQGIDYDERTDLFWIDGYMDDGRASPVYLVNRTDRSTVKTLRLATQTGESFCGHAGGIAVEGDYVYVAGGSDGCIYVYSCDEMMTAEDGASVRCLGSISTGGDEEDALRVAFVSSDGRYLYAGEFYREANYPTPDSHKTVTKSGDVHQALALAYELVPEDGTFGVNPTPTFALSLPDLVQGICFSDGSVFLSSSWGASFSTLYEYDLGALEVSDTISLLGCDFPTYHLDSSALVQERKFPPMAEEIVIADGKLYTMCESASDKYMFGKLTSARWCYATDLSKMK